MARAPSNMKWLFYNLQALYYKNSQNVVFRLIIIDDLTAVIIISGGLLCCLSSFYFVSSGLSADTKYYLALVGQAMTGVACPFISCVPTKISQHWFNDRQRTYATMVIGMANPLGIVLGSLFTPMMVKKPQDIALMNTVWFVPAALGTIITMLKVGTAWNKME